MLWLCFDVYGRTNIPERSDGIGEVKCKFCATQTAEKEAKYISIWEEK
jgi:hypothetical protein